MPRSRLACIALVSAAALAASILVAYVAGALPATTALRLAAGTAASPQRT